MAYVNFKFELKKRNDIIYVNKVAINNSKNLDFKYFQQPEQHLCFHENLIYNFGNLKKTKIIKKRLQHPNYLKYIDLNNNLQFNNVKLVDENIYKKNMNQNYYIVNHHLNCNKCTELNNYIKNYQPKEIKKRKKLDHQEQLNIVHDLAQNYQLTKICEKYNLSDTVLNDFKNKFYNRKFTKAKKQNKRTTKALTKFEQQLILKLVTNHPKIYNSIPKIISKLKLECDSNTVIRFLKDNNYHFHVQENVPYLGIKFII